MKVTDAEFAKSFARLAEDGYRFGYHERNGGNLSYRLTSDDAEKVKDDMNFGGDFIEAGVSVPNLAGEFFMVTGAGKYFRNVALYPNITCGIVEIDSTGTKYRKVWGFADGGVPTSEFPSHLMSHSEKKKTTDGRHRVIYHCHPANITAMTFILPVDDGAFTRVLWESMTECAVVFPKGVGAVEWMVPGGREIAAATAKKMETFDVAVWAHHGIFCSGENFDSAFGLAQTVEKSAEIYMKIRSVSRKKRQTITSKKLKKIAAAFGTTLSEDLLRRK